MSNSNQQPKRVAVSRLAEPKVIPQVAINPPVKVVRFPRLFSTIVAGGLLFLMVRSLLRDGTVPREEEIAPSIQSSLPTPTHETVQIDLQGTDRSTSEAAEAEIENSEEFIGNGIVEPYAALRVASNSREAAGSEVIAASVEGDAVRTLVVNSLGSCFRNLQPGSFKMGSSTAELGRYESELEHSVELNRSYFLGITLVTQREYLEVMGLNPSTQLGDDLPVDNVSWEDAIEFCKRLSSRPAELDAGRVYRLPTEAEWEYACRFGSSTSYYFGDNAEALDEHAWFEDNSNGHTHAVGQLRPNAGGFYDMHGLAWQWCSDWFADYDTTRYINPTGPESGEQRVLRGGSWYNKATDCRAATRGANLPGTKSTTIGFRVVFTDSDQIPVPSASP